MQGDVRRDATGVAFCPPQPTPRLSPLHSAFQLAQALHDTHHGLPSLLLL